MATVQKYIPFDVSSDANFDLIGKGIYDAIVTTAGWTEKADTGRTDWTTNPARPAAGSYLWNIFGPSDALQTGSTVYYVKVEVGLDASSRPSIKVSIGTGTDGSGVLTGFLSAVRTIPIVAIANQGNIRFECSFSGDTGHFGCLLWRNGTGNSPCGFFIERTLATDGTPSSDGVTLVAAIPPASGASSYQQSISFVAGVAFNFTQKALTPVPFVAAASFTFDNKILRGLVLPMLGVLMNPMTVVGNCAAADAAEGSILQMTVYGATRTYMVTKAGLLTSFGIDSSGASTFCLLMRYD